MDKVLTDLHYRLGQLEEFIKNQQNQSALLVLEELKDVITQDYLRFQHIYLTLQEAYPDTTNTRQVDLPSFLKEKSPRKLASTISNQQHQRLTSNP